MTLEIIFLFALTELALSFSPGPAVLLVVTRSMRFGARAGWRASLGIGAANLIFYALSAAGIGAAILASYELFQLIKWAGAAYLVWLGITMLMAGAKGSAGNLDQKVQKTQVKPGQDFLHGFTVQASNPKNLVAFIAIIPQFVTPGPDMAFQFFVLALITLAVELPILAAYAILSEGAVNVAGRKVLPVAEAVGGVWLIAAGAGLALWRRAT
ncbi:MAG: LysE family translocator [Hyphomicrobiales bacterium]